MKDIATWMKIFLELIKIKFRSSSRRDSFSIQVVNNFS